MSDIIYQKATYHDTPSPSQEVLGQICERCYGGVLMDAHEFYREIFPPDTIETCRMDGSDPPGHMGNPLVLIERGARVYPDYVPDWAWGAEVPDDGAYVTRRCKRILFNDYDWLDSWRTLSDVQHVYLSGLTYIGKSRDLAHAVAMHALIFDIDYVTPKALERFFGVLTWSDHVYPAPTHIVLSGGGIHLYYVFQFPIPLYHGAYGRKVKSQLNRLKQSLTRLLWNVDTVGWDHGEKPQYQGINQAFRMVGSYTKSLTLDHDRYRVIAYKFPTKLYDSLELLYRYADDIPKEDQYRGLSVYDLDYWKQKSPDWYQRRIVDGDKSIRYWSMNRRLYEWWLRIVRDQVQFGHRYNSLFCAVVYAVKCNVPKEQVKRDLMALIPVLTDRKPDDPITENDVREALDAYRPELNTYPVTSIEYLSGVDITKDRPRRNGRKQSDHLMGARALEAVYRPDWRGGNGRKPKDEIVRAWREAHPNGRKADCIKETGLSKPTVYKWWNG